MNIILIEKFLPNICYAILILVFGVLLASLSKKLVKKYLKTHNNEMLKNFLANLFSSLIIILTVVSALGKLGVPTASLVAVTGAAGLAIALSLKDFLSNIAAGFMIVFLKPFKVGDFIKINSESGTVTDMTLFMVSLKSTTNECLFIPNNKLINNAILNQSYYDNRRVDLSIGVDYNADLTAALSIISNTLNNSETVLKDPSFTVGVEALADSSINILVRYWVKKANLLPSKMELLQKILTELQTADISIPFPQLDVNIKNNG